MNRLGAAVVLGSLLVLGCDTNYTVIGAIASSDLVTDVADGSSAPASSQINVPDAAVVSSAGATGSVTGTSDASALPDVGVPILWLDATRVATGNTTVATWHDASPAQRNAMQTAAIAQPVYVSDAIFGLPALRFDGVDDNLVVVNDGSFDSDDLTVLLVLSALANPTQHNPAPFGIREAGRARISIHVDGDLLGFHSYNGMREAGYEVALMERAPHVLSFRWAGGQQSQFLDGVNVANEAQPFGPTLRLAVQIGRAELDWESFAGDIGEVIVFDRALTDAEMASLHGYAVSKWGF